MQSLWIWRINVEDLAIITDNNTFPYKMFLKQVDVCCCGTCRALLCWTVSFITDLLVFDLYNWPQIQQPVFVLLWLLVLVSFTLNFNLVIWYPYAEIYSVWLSLSPVLFGNISLMSYRCFACQCWYTSWPVLPYRSSWGYSFNPVLLYTSFILIFYFCRCHHRWELCLLQHIWVSYLFCPVA